MLASCKAFKKPTPIQGICIQKNISPSLSAQCWPILLAGRDCIAIAETGSGKTIAFGLPALSHINKRMRGYDVSKGPMVLVLSPTRELAMQVIFICVVI
jgi:ATP-dependent RNA helicase DBP3